MTKGTLIWDFDGTIADRPYTWSGSILAAFDEVWPAHGVRLEQIRGHTTKNFPWHEPDKDYLHLLEPAAWWASMELVLSRLAASLGAAADAASLIASVARKHIVDPAKYKVFADVVPALSTLRDSGWNHVILSNNYPDLKAIVHGLGLSPYFGSIFTSALIGYEKPRREIYEYVLSRIDRQGEIWMIGDNETADAFGAEQAGIKAVLVRKTPKTFHRAIPDLSRLREIIEA